ncbi:MAG: dTDP-4-dehydrorhamnose 3,5-epimerase, partial [Lentisphaerae bacterium]|nr:dTDP-4-dehydrorhamnose 3,5-epimerase [Lentisphaerota bacterium]
FARFFCLNEFKALGLDASIVQINNSLSTTAGTLRGIHYQLPPKAETKIVRCIRGSLYDVIVDLRPESPTFLKWFGVNLSAENRVMIYTPKNFGHAFLTLEDDTEVLYLVTEFYSPEHERGIRWNDPRLGIDWPITPVEISAKDRTHRDFDSEYHCSPGGRTS